MKRSLKSCFGGLTSIEPKTGAKSQFIPLNQKLTITPNLGIMVNFWLMLVNYPTFVPLSIFLIWSLVNWFVELKSDVRKFMSAIFMRQKRYIPRKRPLN